jgi:uncharacterized protein YutE (UPF0331/DUF86 family)
MVDARRVRRLLQRIEEDLSFPRERAAGDRAALAADRERLAALESVFVTGNRGLHRRRATRVRVRGLRAPGTNADALRLSGRHRVLEPALAEALARSVGFRSVLVHGYAGVDDARVVAQLDRITDLAAFVSALATFAS